MVSFLSATWVMKRCSLLQISCKWTWRSNTEIVAQAGIHPSELMVFVSLYVHIVYHFYACQKLIHGALIQRNMFGNINAPFWLKSCYVAFELPKDLGHHLQVFLHHKTCSFTKCNRGSFLCVTVGVCFDQQTLNHGYLKIWE
jgi:hypothetical protein